MRRHLASLRSICETFGGKPAYCVCGQKASNAVHFSSKEYNTLVQDKGRLVEWRGMTVDSQDNWRDE